MSKTRGIVLSLALAVAVLAGASRAQQTYTWSGATSTWGDNTNWAPNGIPTKLDTAIVGAGTITRTAPYTNLSISPGGATANECLTSLSLTGNGAILLNAGAYNFNVTAAAGETARFVQEGGELVTSGNLTVAGANLANTNGTYTMNGGKHVVTGYAYVGYGAGARGTLNMNGGILEVYSPLRVCHTANNSYATLNINGGAINVKNVAVGICNAAGTTATVTQTGGSFTDLGSAGTINISNQANTRGTWTISGGKLIAGWNLISGNVAGADGDLTISGPSTLVCGGNSIVAGWNGRGVITVNDGMVVSSNVLHLGNAGAASNGTMNLNGGTVISSNTLGMGNNGTGVLNMTNGHLKVNDLISMANSATGKGTGNINGGSVSARRLAVGRQNTGTLNITGNPTIALTGDLSFGGTDAVTSGGTGSFSMSGGALTASGIATYQATPSINPIASWSWTGGSIAVTSAALTVPMTNNGGRLLVGGSGQTGTTKIWANSTYNQTAGSVDIEIDGVSGAADQLMLVDSAAQLQGGAINVSLLGAQPTVGRSWDIALATGGGSIQVGAVSVNLPGPSWSITSDSTKITVIYNTKPEANAGTGQSVTLAVGPAATLHGSGTDDGFIGPLTYAWSRLSGPAAVTFTPNALVAEPQVTFTQSGEYVFELIVNDGQLNSDPSTVSVTVLNDAPSVDAGADQSTTFGAPVVVLHGTASDVYPGVAITTWSLVSGPSTATIEAVNSLATTVTLDAVEGSYIFRLTASDGALESSDDVTVLMVNPLNPPPDVDAGPGQHVQLDAANQTVVDLAGSVSDPLGAPTTATWTVKTKPAGGNLVFFNESDPRTSATISGAGGVYRLNLNGFDGTFSINDVTTVTVAPRAASTVDSWVRY